MDDRVLLTVSSIGVILGLLALLLLLNVASFPETLQEEGAFELSGSLKGIDQGMPTKATLDYCSSIPLIIFDEVSLDEDEYVLVKGELEGGELVVGSIRRNQHSS